MEREKNGRIKGMISRRRLILFYTIQQVIPKICTKFQNPRRISSWEIFDERRKSLHTHTYTITEKTKTIYPLYTSYARGIIKRKISRRNLVLFPIKQQMIHNTCTKLQNPMCNSSWEIFVTNFPMYYTGVRDGKKEKEGRIYICFVFCQTIYLATLNVYTKFEDWLSQNLRNM